MITFVRFFRKGTKKMFNLMTILLQAAQIDNTVQLGAGASGDGNISGLLSGYTGIALIFVSAGFAFAGISVVKKLATGEPDASKSLIRYLIALVVFIVVWKVFF